VSKQISFEPMPQPPLPRAALTCSEPRVLRRVHFHPYSSPLNWGAVRDGCAPPSPAIVKFPLVGLLTCYDMAGKAALGASGSSPTP